MKLQPILPLLVISIYCMCLKGKIIVDAALCLDDQRSLLMQLKTSLTFDLKASTKLRSWNRSIDCCQWRGVACDSEGHVIGLDLSQESISGGFESSSTLFSLHHLQSLNLATTDVNDFGANNFNSAIPSTFNKLEHLTHLDLSNAGFVGQIPIEISYLKKLETLDLSIPLTSHQGLKLEEPNIAMLVKDFSKIKELYLDGIAISAKGNQWTSALSKLDSLEVLSMSSCNLSGPLDSSLSKLRSLSTLLLNRNNIASIIPDSFGNFSNLTVLQLSGCELSGVFPKNIFQISSLQVLDMSDNQDLHGSMPNFPLQGSLYHLNLSHTKFSGPLPMSIQNLRRLSTLDLSNCHFNGTLPISMSDLTHFFLLDLSSNNFTGPLPSFNRSKALTIFSMSNNDLRGIVPSTHFDGLMNLVSIDLGHNSLDGRAPSSLFELPSLQQLTLSYNGFDGLLDEFPNASSSSLEMLDLSSNNFQGPIPVSIFQLKRLSLLQLSSNKFNGTIQLNFLRRLPKLATFDISNNNLSVDASMIDDHDVQSFPNLKNIWLASCKLREFPAFLRNLSTLFLLDLSSNEIEGSIPNWIWRFENLIYLNLSNNFLTVLEGPFQNYSANLLLLDLHGNQLQGPAPIFTENVIYLDYSNNRFNYITPDIGNHISSAVYLYLSNNNFDRKIHESFCHMSTLRVLDLSHNSFIGEVPKCLTSSGSLKVLSLAGNKLSGQIPDTFSTSCALRFLDINGNLLMGTLPESLANCQNLQVLNVGSNQLIDRFPCFLKNISTLRVMILRSNKFHGHLECSNINSNWETLQIVDLASNNLSGVLSATLLQSWKALMPDDNEVRSRFDPLSFNIYDNVSTNIGNVNFKTITEVFSSTNIMKFAKIAAIESLYVFEHLLAHVIEEVVSLRRYEDSVTIVIKGQQMKLEKILIAFTSLDFSSNHFEGMIPEELMSFKALHALNLSQNNFSGIIPSTLGNLKNLESLDLSINSLSGAIPTELASLSFLSIMNLSYNHLVGQIPIGTQIQSFGADSFIGNEGLCGVPLPRSCGDEEGKMLPPGSPPSYDATQSQSSIDWSFLSVELGFTFGFGIFIMPLVFWKRWRLCYSKKIDDVLYKFVPQFSFVYEHRGGKKYRTLRWKPY